MPKLWAQSRPLLFYQDDARSRRIAPQARIRHAHLPLQHPRGSQVFYEEPRNCTSYLESLSGYGTISRTAWVMISSEKQDFYGAICLEILFIVVDTKTQPFFYQRRWLNSCRQRKHSWNTPNKLKIHFSKRTQMVHRYSKWDVPSSGQHSINTAITFQFSQTSRIQTMAHRYSAQRW